MEYQELPDINGWAALRAIVEQGGVSAAAVALNIGQPAVTKRLRALEASYGTRLMERVSGRLRLTPAGEKVYLLAVQTLDRQRALNEEFRDLHLGQNTLSLEVTFSIGEHLLPDLLFQFADRYPDYKIDSRMAYGRDIQFHLVTGHTDLALMENAPDHPDVLVQKWADDELWLVCGASHPLAGTDWLPIERLTELPYVLREKHASSREELEQALSGIGIEKLNVTLEVGSTDTIVEMLARGKHVSFLPRFAVADKVQRGDLYHIKITGFRILRTLWIARNRAKLDHPVAEAFVDLLRSMTVSQPGM